MSDAISRCGEISVGYSASSQTDAGSGLSAGWRPFTAREVYRQEWTGLTEPRVVQGALECLAELGWIRPEAVRAPDGGRPTVRFHLNPRLRADGPPRSRPQYIAHQPAVKGFRHHDGNGLGYRLMYTWLDR